MRFAGSGRARWVLLAAFVVATVAVIGGPLVRSGILLPTKLPYIAYPWKADDPYAGGQAMTQGPLSDTVDSVYPGRSEMRTRLEDHDLPMWDPYIAGGGPAPVLSLGIYNPMNLPYLLGPLDWAPALAKTIELLTAMVATAGFVRLLGLSRLAAGVAGVVYALSASPTMWTNWPQSQVATVIPVVLWATELALRKRRWIASVPLALATAMLLLGGFPAVALHGLLLAGAYALVRLACQPGAWSERLTGGGRALLGVALGGALAAFALIPFSKALGATDLAYRKGDSNVHLPLEGLVTVVNERALGLANHGGYVGPGNQVEVVSFIGVVAVVLAMAGLILARPAALPRGVRAFFAVAAAVIGVALFFGGPVLGAMQALIPTFDQNPIGRARAVFAFVVTILAAIGVDAIRQVEQDRLVVRLLRLFAVLGLAGLVARPALNDLRSTLLPTGRLPEVRHELILTALLGAGAAALAVVALALNRRPALAAGPLVVVCLLAGGDSVRFAHDLMPSGDTATLYPETEAHAWLADHLGEDRFAANGWTMFPDSNVMFDLRSVNGHTFHDPAWKALLLEADPKAFSASPTFSQLHATADVVSSPVLDRLGATYFVADRTLPVVGAREAGAAHATGALGGGGDIVISASGPARAVSLPLARRPATETARLELRDATGATTWRSERSAPELQAADNDIALPLDGIAPGAPWSLVVHAPAGFVLAKSDVTVVRPADDGLQLAYSGDATIYGRERALPRIRYASRSTIDDAAVPAFAGVPKDTVVLKAGTPDSVGGSGSVDVTEDDPDKVRIETTGDGDGYVVVADALRTGWDVKVDGQPATLRPADGAAVAVAVGPGEHVVTLDYRPPGRSLGFLVSVVGGIVVLALVVLEVVRRRRSSAPDRLEQP